MSRLLPMSLALAVLALAPGCGPRADAPAGGPDRGTAPGIVYKDSTIPTPAWKREGADITFPIRYVIRAVDADKNMRWVDITVTYDDPCLAKSQQFDFTDDLPADDWVRDDIMVDGTTIDKLQVPESCYPVDNVFNVSVWVRDYFGNRSNILPAQVTVSPSQGPGG